MNRHDPRIRQTIDRISTRLENAQVNTQASLFSFSESYVTPCLNSFSSCLESACYPCIGARRDRVRARQRRNQLAANRGRPEFVFDFYTADWDEEEEEDERTGLLSGWGADELDRLLAGGSGGEQPKRQKQMNYGTRGTRARRRSTGAGKIGEGDSTILPGSSMFGFLERLPWGLGARGVRYKPSAADLQDVPGGSRKDSDEGEASALLDSDDEEDVQGEGSGRKHKRNRSATVTSQSTTHSLSSRGDLFPSEDEAADAVPLDDEFAITLTRRSTSNDDFSSGRTGKTKSSRSMSKSTTRSRTKRKSLSRTHTGRSARKHGAPTITTPKSGAESIASSDKTPSSIVTPADGDEFVIESPTPEARGERGLPTMEELEREEEQVRGEEEAEAKQKRDAARLVAEDRGLTTSRTDEESFIRQDETQIQPPTSPTKPESTAPSKPDDSKDDGG
ncbi:hypothetical protein MMC10_000433 [Thelotrema lepadinum]|nr:hypothetical protein [Thelotrema lepadinum]